MFISFSRNPPRPLASGRVEICVLLPVFLLPVFLLPVNRPLPYPSPAGRAEDVGGSMQIAPSRGRQLVVLKRPQNVFEKLLIFDGFLIDFRPQLGANLASRIDQNP